MILFKISPCISLMKAPNVKDLQFFLPSKKFPFNFLHGPLVWLISNLSYMHKKKISNVVSVIIRYFFYVESTNHLNVRKTFGPLLLLVFIVREELKGFVLMIISLLHTFRFETLVLFLNLCPLFPLVSVWLLKHQQLLQIVICLTIFIPFASS
jgi:hypothetical protein